MLKYLILIFLPLTLSAQTWTAGDVQVYETFDDMTPIFELGGDTIHVINFWATWCGPCVKELPYFEELDGTIYKGRPVEVILVSLDLPRHLDTKVLDFLNKNKIGSEVVLLADGKPNSWIDKVDPSWSGAIPITVLYDENTRSFYEREFHSLQELQEVVSELHNSEK